MFGENLRFATAGKISDFKQIIKILRKLWISCINGHASSYLSHVTRKPVFGVCDLVGLKPACSVAETS